MVMFEAAACRQSSCGHFYDFCVEIRA